MRLCDFREHVTFQDEQIHFRDIQIDGGCKYPPVSQVARCSQTAGNGKYAGRTNASQGS